MNKYWADKYKTQTQMLRVIHDQMHDLDEDMHKVADTLGRVASYMGTTTTSFVANSKRIDLLVERIDLLSSAIVKWEPITVKQKKEWEKSQQKKGEK